MAAIIFTISCDNVSPPSSCIGAAQDAGLPDGVIDQLRNPADLEAGERLDLNRVLREAGIAEEFAKLDPDNMDNLDRILWRSKLHPYDHLGFYNHAAARGDEIPSLHPGIYCRDYWAEPLGPENADLRNHGVETQCRRRLEERITSRYSQLADEVDYDEDNHLVYKTPNQYVRVLQWLDMSGDELLESDRPPYIVLLE